MATIADRFSFKERRPDMLSGTPRAHAVDRWIFVFMAAWFIVVTLVGFIPDAIGMVADVQAGRRPPLPPILHVHAIAMGSFLLLLLAQSVLMATGRTEQHKRLGVVAFALVPVLVVVGLILAPTIYHQMWDFAQAEPSPARTQIQGVLHALENILLLQMRVGIVFPLCIAIGLKARAGNAGLHKRMMFLGTAVALGASLDRMAWLPTTLPATPVSQDFWVLAALSPMIVWDLVRNKKLHEAYWIWLVVYVPACLVVYSLWDTPTWHSTARAIMGV